ncbi:MAG: hypothetical protein ACP5IG_03135 [Candidatus Micrarchaeia archaeon]
MRKLVLASAGVALIAVALLAGMASALSLQASASSVSLTDESSARLIVSFTNDDSQPRLFEISAQSSIVDAWFDASQGLVPAGATKSIIVRLSTPSCFEGDFPIKLSVSLKRPDGSKAESASLRVVASVYPLRECPQYFHAKQENYNEYNGAHAYFDPSYYYVQVSPVFPQSDTIKIEPGILRTIKVELRNFGAAGDFQLKLVGDDDALKPVLWPEKLALSRNEVGKAEFDVRCENAAEGDSLHLALQVIEGGRIVGWKDFTFKVVAPAQPARALQPSVNASPDNSSLQYAIEITVSNPGNETLKEVYATITGLPDGWIVKSPAPFDLQPGENATKKIYVEATTSEEAAKPVLVVSSEGKEIYRKELEPIKGKNGGITGMFIAAVSNNLIVIAVILGVAVVVALASARFNFVAGRASYYEKLAAIREAVSQQQARI